VGLNIAKEANIIEALLQKRIILCQQKGKKEKHSRPSELLMSERLIRAKLNIP
jgi:hypothetical protein